MADPSDDLRGALVAMTASKSDQARVIAHSGHAYLIVERTLGRDELELLAPASHHLEGSHRVSQPGAQWLRTQGFERSRGRRDFRRALPSTTPVDEIVETISRVLSHAYDVPGVPRSARVEHDDRAHPSNPEVLDAMRRLASTRDHGDRIQLYNTLVNATLLVPFSPTASDSADGPEAWSELDGNPDKPVFCVFTDWPHLRMWSLHITEYQPLHGAEFFEELIETPAVGLRINPNGDVGGELFRHELEMIVKGVRRWQGKR